MSNLRAETLARAAQVVGGVEVLAVELALSPEIVARYIRGDTVVPTDVFLRATEIVTDAGVLDAAKVLQPEQKPSA